MRCSGTLMRLSRPILGAVVAVLLAPQAAQAAVLDPLGPCYRSVDSETRETVPVHGTGLHAGRAGDRARSTAVVAQDGVVADTDGEVIGGVPAPYQASGERPFTLTVTEDDQPANTASASSRVTALDAAAEAAHGRAAAARALHRPRLHRRHRRCTRTTCARASTARRSASAPRRAPAAGSTSSAASSRSAARRRALDAAGRQPGRPTAPSPLGVFVRLAITVSRGLPRPTR